MTRLNSFSESYIPNDLEGKWQKKWSDDQVYKVDDYSDSDRKKWYELTMFPYTSGDIHIGHWYAMAPSDAHARFMNMIGFNVLQSLTLLGDSADSFTQRCLLGLTPNKGRISDLMWGSLMLVTALAPKIGYDQAAKIAKEAHKNGTTLEEEAIKTGLIDKETFIQIVKPETMIKPSD